MNIKVLEAIGKFVDKNLISSYTIEGYYGFAYLSIKLHHGDGVLMDQKWLFTMVGDEVVRELVEQ